MLIKTAILLGILFVIIFSSQEANAESRYFDDFNGNFQEVSNITINVGESIDSIGLIEITTSGIINNYGTINVNWKIKNIGTINNYGSITGNGTLENLETGVINNFAGGYVGGNGSIDNKGRIENSGTESNLGVIELRLNDLNNSGTINNNAYGEIKNGSKIKNQQSGIINNHANGLMSSSHNNNIDNQGTIINHCGGVIRSSSTFIFTGNPIQESSCIVEWDGGGDGSNWSDPKNWTFDKLPIGSDSINLGKSSEYTSVILDTDFTITTGTLVINSNYKLITVTGKTLDNQGTIENNGLIWCLGGGITNSGFFTNNEKITDWDDCVIENKENGEFTNSDHIDNRGTLLNSGVFNNDGTIDNDISELYPGKEKRAKLSNTGTFYNNKQITMRGLGLGNTEEGIFQNHGKIEYSYNLLDNQSWASPDSHFMNGIGNSDKALFNNYGTITLGDFDSLGNVAKFNNEGTIIVHGELENNDQNTFCKIDTNSYFKNKGTIEINENANISDETYGDEEVFSGKLINNCNFINSGLIKISGSIWAGGSAPEGVFKNRWAGVLNNHTFDNTDKGVIENNGDLRNDGSNFINRGVINNFELFSNRQFIQNDGKIINDGTFTSHGPQVAAGVFAKIINNGEIQNNDELFFSGNVFVLENSEHGIIQNDGTISMSSHVNGIKNFGTFVNSKTLKIKADDSRTYLERTQNYQIPYTYSDIGYTFENHGFLENLGTIENKGNIKNEKQGTLDNKGTIEILSGYGGNIMNHGKMLNTGTMKIHEDPVRGHDDFSHEDNFGINNDGTIINNGTLDIYGKIDNNNIISNDKIITVYDPALFFNRHEFLNYKTLDVIGCFKNIGLVDSKGIITIRGEEVTDLDLPKHSIGCNYYFIDHDNSGALIPAQDNIAKDTTPFLDNDQPKSKDGSTNETTNETTKSVTPDTGTNTETDTGTTIIGNLPENAEKYVPPTNAKTPIVSTRGHTQEFAISNPVIITGHTKVDYDTTKDIPGLNQGTSPQEIVIYVHGFDNSEIDAAENFNLMQASLKKNKYYHPVIGFSWDSNPGKGDFLDGVKIATLNGEKLAQFIIDFKCQNPNTKIRLVTHSLGAQVALDAITTLSKNTTWSSGNCGDGKIDSVSLLGAAVDNEKVHMENYGTVIESVVGEIRNYWNSEDDVLSTWYPFDTPLGESGAQKNWVSDTKLPSNYLDVNVTEEVGDDHSGYNTHTTDTDAKDPDEDGVIDRLVEQWSNQVSSNIPSDSVGVAQAVTPETSPEVTPETTPEETISEKSLAGKILVKEQKENKPKEIPKWVKNNAKWFAEEKISDKDFATGIGFMIKEEIIKVDNVKIAKDSALVISDSIQIPDWVQNNAKWWANGLIPDQDFKLGIQYMVKEKIIDLSSENETASKQEIQTIQSSLRGNLFNTIITDPTLQDKEKAVEILVKIATINHISSQINLEIRNYLDKFLDDEMDAAWEQYSDDNSSESRNYAISLQTMVQQNKNEITKWKTLTENSEQARENLLNSALNVGLDKFSFDKNSIEEFGEYKGKIKNEKDLKNVIKDLKSFKSDFGKLLFQLDVEIDLSNFGSNDQAVALWCEPNQLGSSDTVLVLGICADIPTSK